jgi:hypothetical protein
LLHSEARVLPGSWSSPCGGFENNISVHAIIVKRTIVGVQHPLHQQSWRSLPAQRSQGSLQPVILDTLLLAARSFNQDGPADLIVLTFWHNLGFNLWLLGTI